MRFSFTRMSHCVFEIFFLLVRANQKCICMSASVNYTFYFFGSRFIYKSIHKRFCVENDIDFSFIFSVIGYFVMGYIDPCECSTKRFKGELPFHTMPDFQIVTSSCLSCLTNTYKNYNTDGTTIVWMI